MFVAERYGFRRRLSTANGTRWLDAIILNVCNNNRYSGGVLCDGLKCLVVQIMNCRYNKLQRFADKGRHSDGFKSYRYSRTQRVELEFSNTCNYSSTWKTVKCGVPVGSVLGPLMFSVYNNDVPCSVDNSSNVIMYTHDKAFQQSIIAVKKLIEISGNFIQHPHIFQGNHLLLNIETTKT